MNEIARFDDLQPGETVHFDDWPWPQTVASVEHDGNIVTVRTEQGGRPYVAHWFAEVTRALEVSAHDCG